jgi:hypothetical protein
VSQSMPSLFSFFVVEPTCDHPSMSSFRTA